MDKGLYFLTEDKGFYNGREENFFGMVFFLAKTVVNMSPQYTKWCKNTTFRAYISQIHRFFIFQEKIMISEFWKYNGYNEVPLYFYKSENKIFFILRTKKGKYRKQSPKNYILLHLLVYCWGILRLCLAQKNHNLVVTGTRRIVKREASLSLDARLSTRKVAV